MAIEWMQKGNLRGPQGLPGEKGDPGAQGAGFRLCSVDLTGNSDVNISNINPNTNIQVGDLLIDPQGDVWEVASIGDGTVHTGTASTLNIMGPQGPKGDPGEKGADGTGVTILGSYDDEGALIEAHPSGDPGDAYIVDGDLFVWDGDSWQNVGQIQGPQGDTGPQGVAATVAIGTTQTGNAGTQAQVTNSGNENAAVFNFVIPRGDKGDTGPAGPGVSVGSGTPVEPGQLGECYIDVSTGNLYRCEDVGD